MQRFAAWCIQIGWWWYYRFEISYLSITYLGAIETNSANVQRWSKPLFEAFIAGAWILHWTDDTLYWVAKPTVHMDPTPGTRRLHSESTAALESDIEPLYFWHGVLVPSFVVEHPDLITLNHIMTEENAEVRRILIERYGQARYLIDSKATIIHNSGNNILYKQEIPGDEPLVMVRVINCTPEPTGECKEYFLRVPPDMTDADQAVAWTFGKTKDEYQPGIET
jgi:hypothetical protein